MSNEIATVREVAGLDPTVVETVRADMEQFGGEEAVFERLGVGIDELAQHTQFGSYEGPLWDAVKSSLLPQDQRPPGQMCPVGDRLQDPDVRKDGVAGVNRVLQGFNMADPRFKVYISERTVARAATVNLKKKI